jgi:hypothetical protein
MIVVGKTPCNTFQTEILILVPEAEMLFELKVLLPAESR